MVTQEEIEKIEKEFEEFKQSFPKHYAPKSKIWGTGCYYTTSHGEFVKVIHNEIADYWAIVDENDEVWNTFETKKQALNSLI